MKKVTVFETFRNMRADFRHWCKLYSKRPSPLSWVSWLFLPGTIAATISRCAHYCYVHKLLRPLSRLIYLFNITITGADISPDSSIGGGIVFFHSVGTMIAATIGKDVVIAGRASIGADGSRKDVGAGPGLPVIGDNVKIGVNVTILGPVVIGKGASVAFGSVVGSDVPEYTLVKGNPAAVVKKISPEYNIFYRPK